MPHSKQLGPSMSSLPDAVLSEPLLPHRPLSPPEPPMSGVPSLAASLKPLLNPLQTEATPPASTIVEPPRSPNPSNPATNEKGTNVDADLISAGGSTLGTADGEVNGQDENVELAPPPQIPPFSISPIPSSAAEQPALSPLPTDAPMPLTPKAQDEPPPVLAAGEIPPTVSTPNMITSEDQGMPIESARTPTSAMQTPRGEDILPDAFPTPADTRFDPIALLKTPIDGAAPDVPVEAISRSADGDQPPSDEPMEVDAVGEEEGRTSVDAAPGMESSVSTSSLKRAGEDLKGREEKRVKEDVQADNESTLQPPAPASAPAPAAADGAAPVPLLPWQSYTPPRPRPAGPTSTLTVTQHKHLLNAVRSLKKAKDAPGFLVPVDTVLFGIPHYHQVIPRPMDLGTVETKLFVSDPRGPPKDKSRMSKWDTSKGSYNSVNEAVEDVRQIWENTRKFNGPDHIVSQAATRLDDTFQTMLNNMPSEVGNLFSIIAIQTDLCQPTPAPAPAPAPAPLPSPVAGPSTTPTARRASVSQPPVIRRTSDGPDSRPKREIHPPPSKDLAYADGGIRKPKRRNDPQLQWASRTLKGFETSTKYFDAVSPFLYPVSQIISELPDYANLIKRPIDLNQIKDRMNDGDYEDVSQVNADLRLMTSNAMKFNPPGHAVHQAAQQFLQSWDEKWKTCPPKQEMRDGSEDPGAEDYDMDSEEEESE